MRDEPGVRPRDDRGGDVLRADGRRAADRAVRRHVGGVVLQGDLRPSGDGGEDGAAVHPPQQGVESVREPEEGVQGDLLAGGDHPVLPAGEAVEGCGDGGAMLHRAGEAGMDWCLVVVECRMG